MSKEIISDKEEIRDITRQNKKNQVKQRQRKSDNIHKKLKQLRFMGISDILDIEDELEDGS